MQVYLQYKFQHKLPIIPEGKGPGDRQQQKIMSLQSTVRMNEGQIKDAETRALEAETDAREKDKELSEALERMRQYEEVL